LSRLIIAYQKPIASDLAGKKTSKNIVKLLISTNKKQMVKIHLPKNKNMAKILFERKLKIPQHNIAKQEQKKH
jgi:hypothetical protein